MQREQRLLRTFAVLTVCGLAFGCAGADDGQPNENAAQINQAVFNAYKKGYWLDPADATSNFASSVKPNGYALDVCQAEMPDGTSQPGKLWQGYCRVSWGGKALYRSNYKLLYDDGGFWWTDAREGRGNLAVIGDNGVADPNQPGSHVYICEAYFRDDNLWHPGKWWNDYCALEWKGRNQTVKPYDQPDAVHILNHY